jgi:multisubunit Na+/H+ antiporter MnhB subunit
VFDPTAAVYALILFMFLGAIIAAEARDLLSTVISVSAVGAALSVIALLVGAPDIAITQVVVEVLCLILLIRVVVRREDETYETHPADAPMAMGLVFAAFLVVVSAVGFAQMRPFGQPALAQDSSAMGAEYLRQSFSQTGSANAVMGVLLDFRAYDTLGEATVIFAAVIGAYVLLRKVGRVKKT